MLTMSEEQTAALDQASLARFVADAASHLRERFPALTGGQDENALHGRITEDIERAAGYGVEDEADVLRYLEFSARYGPRFDEELPWAQAELARPHRDGTRKMDNLDAWDLFAVQLPMLNRGAPP